MLGRGVDPAPVIPAERLVGVVVGDDVLTQLGADALEDEPQVADDGEVPQHRVAALHDVVDRHSRECGDDPDQHPLPPAHRTDARAVARA